MIDKITYLETDSEKFPLAFTLNVMEALAVRVLEMALALMFIRKADMTVGVEI